MGARILVADDSVTIQKVVELTFSKEDFTLTQARSGDETIRKAREVRPDLVLLDLVMPDMNGYDVCAALRAEPALRSVPVILLAGTFESFDQQRGAQVGANDFVTKPFESQVLISKVKQLLFAKAMETDRTAAPTRLTGDAVTARIPPGYSALRATGPNPAASASDGQLAPPVTPPAVSDTSWPARVSAPAVSPPAPPSEPSVEFGAETADSERPLAEPGGSGLDLSSIELEPVPTPTEAASDALDVLPLPESLSLDELLGVEPDAPLAAVSAPAPEPAVSEPVFELTETDAPPLPMVEAGGEPLALAVEDLIGTSVRDAVPEDALTLELPELDLAALSEAPSVFSQEGTPADTAGSDVPAEPTQAVGEEPSEVRTPTLVMETVSAPAVPDVAPVANAADVALGEPTPSEAPVETRGPLAREAGAAPEVSVEAGAPPAVTIAPDEMAAMRDAVTSRVAEELRQELSEKLLERFEKIVWDVVPDLAEILITKEIERIRRLAEEERQS